MKLIFWFLYIPFKVLAVILWNAFGIAVSAVEVTYDMWSQFFAELLAEFRELRKP